jgi:hypothetical protein
MTTIVITLCDAQKTKEKLSQHLECVKYGMRLQRAQVIYRALMYVPAST